MRRNLHKAQYLQSATAKAKSALPQSYRMGWGQYTGMFFIIFDFSCFLALSFHFCWSCYQTIMVLAMACRIILPADRRGAFESKRDATKSRLVRDVHCKMGSWLGRGVGQ